MESDGSDHNETHHSLRIALCRWQRHSVRRLALDLTYILSTCLLCLRDALFVR